MHRTLKEERPWEKKTKMRRKRSGKTRIRKNRIDQAKAPWAAMPTAILSIRYSILKQN